MPSSEPLVRTVWTDPVTGKRGYFVVHSLVSGLATGGTRMRAGCTLSEVEDLAAGMARKTAVFNLPVGGAKGGIDCDPKNPEAYGLLTRFMQAMRPWLDDHWVTAEDLGVPQSRIDSVFADLDLDQSYHAAIERSADPARTLRRVNAGLNAPVPGGALLGDVIGGYGVAQSSLGVAAAWEWDTASTTVAVQGVGTMGGAAAYYLHEAGCRVTAVADAAGTIVDPAGLDVPALLDLRDGYGEIDRARLPEGVRCLPREAVLSTDVDILIPAAVSYAITPEVALTVSARVIVEAANVATTPEAESMLAARGIPVIPDFVANTGAAAWAWWLLFGYVGAEPADSFQRLRGEMLTKTALLMQAWDTEGVMPRATAQSLAETNAAAREAEQADAEPVLIP
jgi:glutamate dehydrogenase (NAD(P)+)